MKHSNTEVHVYESTDENSRRAALARNTIGVLVDQHPAWELREFGEFGDTADVIDRFRLANVRRIA